MEVILDRFHYVNKTKWKLNRMLFVPAEKKRQGTFQTEMSLHVCFKAAYTKIALTFLPLTLMDN